jgi:hypothetical protein
VTLENKEVDTKRLNEQREIVVRETYDIWDHKIETEGHLTVKIRQWASIEKEIMVQTGNEWAINQICTNICKRIQKEGNRNNLVTYICHTLDDEFKDTALEKSSLRSLIADSALPIEVLTTANEFIETLERIKTSYPEFVGRGGFQDIAQLIHDSKNRIEKLAEQYRIPLPYEKDKLDEEDDEKTGLDPAGMPRDEQVIFYRDRYAEELENSSKDYDDLRESVLVRNYVSDNPRVGEKLTLGVKAYRLLKKPYVDKKWQRDWLEWCDIIQNYYEQGGTYASSKSAVNIAESVNPKTGKPFQRKITKEQIDAVHVKYLNQMRFMLKMFASAIVKSKVVLDVTYGIGPNGKYKEIRGSPLTEEQLKIVHPHILEGMRYLIGNMKYIEGLSENYKDKEEGFRAKRADDLHDVLSEAA